MGEITEPKVYLVSQTKFNEDMFNVFLRDEGIDKKGALVGHNDTECTVEAACRLCYMSYGKGRKEIKKFLDNIIRSKHGSVLEHVNFGFIITGVSRSLTHELIRHRAGFAYSQLSQRFVNPDEVDFVVPPLYLDERYKDIRELVVKEVQGRIDLYKEMSSAANITPRSERKKHLEAVRSVLPNATETKIYVTGNIRAWRHFCELRGSEHADAEIRRLALIILQILQDEAPLFFDDLKIVNGTVRTENSKV